MSEPMKTDDPTLQTVMIELVSAQSSLNMPTPMTAPGHDVEHAYQHLQEATRQLHDLMKLELMDEEFVPPEPPSNVVDYDFAALCAELGIDVTTGMTRERAWHLDVVKKTLEAKLLSSFDGAVNDGPTRHLVKVKAMQILKEFVDRGELR